MFQLASVLIFVLQFKAGASGRKDLYVTPGHDVILPCGDASPSGKCQFVTWLYNRDPSNTFTLFMHERVLNSGRTTRLSLDHDCSLVIKHIAAEDAGLYTCRQNGNPDFDIYLSVLTISLTPPDADPKRAGEVTLQCSLKGYTDGRFCSQKSVRWVNETGTVLLGEGVGYRLDRRTNCLSFLTVWPQSGHDRKYTCQVVDEENNVEAETDYTSVFRDGTGDDQRETSEHFAVIVGAVVGVVVVLLVLAAVLITCRRRHNAEGSHSEYDVKNLTQHPEEPGSSLTYATLNHSDQGGSPKKMVKQEEEVTYSTVKIPVKTETDKDPSSLFSCVSRPK